MRWSREQLEAKEQVLAGRNVFITGGGGVGKSHLMRHLVDELRMRGRCVHVTGSTGIVAVAAGGTTFHSLLGLGLAREPLDISLRQFRRNKKLVTRWTASNMTIFLDEVSMLHPSVLDLADGVARAVRKQPRRAFGGIQVVLLGDFAQLPPIIEAGYPHDFCFETRAWADLGLTPVELFTIFRQRDARLIAALGRLRFGLHTEEDLALFRARVGARLDETNGVRATHLFPTLEQVRLRNEAEMKLLKGPEHSFAAEVTRVPSAAMRDDADTRKALERLASDVQKQPPAPLDLRLKVGAQVILLANLDFERRLINGSRGVVESFSEPDEALAFESLGYEPDRLYPIVLFENGERAALGVHAWKTEEPRRGTVVFCQVPLNVAFALTMHKCQGMSIDKAVLAVNDRVFAHGQAYVALSRMTSLEGLSLTSFEPSAVLVHPKVIRFYANGCRWPAATAPAPSPDVRRARDFLCPARVDSVSK